MEILHTYKVETLWTGNKGIGTADVSAYDRTHEVSLIGKPKLTLTTDDATHGNKALLNPEDLLVSAISSCHMLSYLYLCAKSGVVIESYSDAAVGTMVENPKGGGQFKEVVLHPVFVVKEAGMVDKAIRLHKKAHEICFIANSLNFSVHIRPQCKLAEQA